MKNGQIVALCNAGVLQMQALSLDATQAYKVYKFRKAVEKAYNDIIEAQKGLIKEAGIEDGKTFTDRLKALRGKKERTDEEAEELEKMNSQDTDLGKLITELYEDDTAIDCKALPYEAWHALRKENKLLADNGIETVLLDVLWAEPEEAQEAKP